MNLDQVNTPSDLMEENNKLSEEQQTRLRLLSEVIDQGPTVGLNMVKVIVEKLISFHQDGLKTKIEEENIEQILYWTTDLNTLQTVSNLLEKVEM